MKKRTDIPISMRTVERDLKTLFQAEAFLSSDIGQDEPAPTINLEQAVQLFDRLRAAESAATRSSRELNWSHPSVLTLNDPDPISAIVTRARNMVLKAMEQGWSGPPYNPFALAEMLGIKLLPTEDVLDARTHSDSSGRFTIEFNPQRPAARTRYSIAHELGHTLFPDCAEATRNRATHIEMQEDDWQLESLCNIAAAEILIPFGTLHEELSMRPSIGLILELRRKYLVSCEAIANRLTKLSAYPCVAFLARRDSVKSRYFVEYRIASPALREEFPVHRGCVLPRSSKASECIAIGTRGNEDARWISGGRSWFVEYLGISPNTGELSPRVLGLAFPPLGDTFRTTEKLRVLPGDASEPFGAEPKLLLQVVNDQALIWGGGFAKQARKKWPNAQTHFREWAYGRRNLKLGNIHAVRVLQNLTLVSMVCQHGFGKATSGPRLRYGALFSALDKVAALAAEAKATVHMPRIGTGEAGGSWNIIEGIIRETLISKGIEVTIYDLRPRSQESPRQPAFEFPRDMVDEVI